MKVLSLCILVHGPGTRTEALVEWAFDQGHAVDIRNLHDGDPLPTVTEFDWLISTGGLMNVYEDAEFPFLPMEAALLRRAVEAGRAVLGLCLGAQLLARAFDARVRPNSEWEVGWYPVQINDHYLGKANLIAFHRHQDTFEMPPGATRIATNAVTENQGFRLSPRVVGLQFHPEATHEWVRECSVDPHHPKGLFVQEPSELVQGLIHQPAMNYWLRRLLQQIEGDL